MRRVCPWLWRLAALGASVGGFVGCAPGGSGSPFLADAGLGKSDPSRTTLAVRVADRDWTYILRTPTTYDAEQPAALVLVLHGSGEDGNVPLERNGWTTAADTWGFVIAVPNALPVQPDQPADFFTNPRMWNSGQPLPDEARAAIDDVAFFDGLIDDIAGRVNVDRTRVFVAGHSSGGSMAFRLAAERTEQYAALAVVAGQCWLDAPRPTRPVPTLYITGTVDLLAPLAGGTQDVLWLHRTTPPVAESLAKWAAALGCSGDPRVVSDAGGVQTRAYNSCADNVPFTAIFVAGQGHVWPGGSPYLPAWLTGPATNRLNATDAICTFFASVRP